MCTLLCAIQLLDRLEKTQGDFLRDHREELKRLRLLLEGVSKVRSAIDFGDQNDREKFLQWFEKFFLYDMTPAPVEEE